MTDKKTKPPRPPAPNLSSKKHPLPSTIISLRYNPLMGSDDDDLNDDSDTGISFITNKERSPSGVQLSKSVSLDGVPTLMKTDVKASKQEPHRHSLDANSRKSKDEIVPVNKPVEKFKEQPLRAQPSASQTNGADKKKVTASTDAADAKPSKPVRTTSGLIKVPSAILKEDEKAPFLPTDCEEATTDPLTFMDIMLEEQFEKQALEEEAEHDKRKENRASLAAHHKRARSLDIDAYKSNEQPENTLDIDPCYYTIPAPSELPEEAVIQRPISAGSPHVRHRKAPPKDMSLSLSGLLATSKDETEEDVSASTQSSRSNLDSPDSKQSEFVSDGDLLKSPSTPTAKDEASQVAPDTQESAGSTKKDPNLQNTPPVLFLSVLSLCIFVYFQFPLSFYLSGVFVGMLLMFYLMLLFIWLTMPTGSGHHTEAGDRVWDEDDRTPLVIPGVAQSASVIRSKEQKRVMQKVRNFF